MTKGRHDALRKFHRAAFFLWVMPGLPASILLRNSLTWITFLSVYSILGWHGLGWQEAAEDD